MPPPVPRRQTADAGQPLAAGPLRRAGVRAIAAAATAAAALAALPAAADGPAPHRAAYELRLDRVAPGADVVAAAGAMTLEWARTCDGWVTTHESRVRVVVDDGRELESEVSFSSYEADDGQNYLFSSRTLYDGAEAEVWRGRGVREQPEGRLRLLYDRPEGGELTLDADVVLPMQHMRAVLAAAQAGGKRYFARYVDGARPQESPFDTNLLVLGDRQPGDTGPGAGIFAAADRPWWPMRMAFFAAGAGAAPEFEIGAAVQDDGIARALDHDYGDWTMTGDLVALERLALPECGGAAE